MHANTTTSNTFRTPRRRAPHQSYGRTPYDALRPWSAITHGIGAALAIIGTIALLLRANPLRLGVCAIYGLSMIGLYTASTLYHCLNVPSAGRIALRKYDHCAIYLLIAGSYTPICTIALASRGGTLLLGVVWTVGLLGIVLTLVKLTIPRWLCSLLYLLMGWVALFAIVPLYQSLSAAGFFWLLAGGVLYTAGGILYALRWPGRNNPRFGCHEVFHLLILLGSAAHYVLICQLVR